MRLTTSSARSSAIILILLPMLPPMFSKVMALLAAAQHSLATSPVASAKDWELLSASVKGRLHTAVPLAAPCFSVVNGVSSPSLNATACAAVKVGYTNPDFRSPRFSGYMIVRRREDIFFSQRITNSTFNHLASMGDMSEDGRAVSVG
jgi:hypothetical protein